MPDCVFYTGGVADPAVLMPQQLTSVNVLLSEHMFGSKVDRNITAVCRATSPAKHLQTCQHLQEAMKTEEPGIHMAC